MHTFSHDFGIHSFSITNKMSTGYPEFYSLGILLVKQSTRNSLISFCFEPHSRGHAEHMTLYDLLKPTTEKCSSIYIFFLSALTPVNTRFRNFSLFSSQKQGKLAHRLLYSRSSVSSELSTSLVQPQFMSFYLLEFD